MQIEHKKNSAYYLAFPMVNTSTPESFVTGETVTDTAYYKDGAGSWTSLAIADTVAEIGSTGVYEIDLSASEMNHDQVIIKMTSSNGADTAFLFDMRGNVDPDTALTDIGLDHLLSASVTGTDVSDDSIIAKMVSSSASADWDDFVNTNDSLQAISTAVGTAAGGSAAISIQAESYTLTSGTQSANTFSDTATVNGTYHQHTDSAGVMDLYYQFDAGGAGVGVETIITGYLQGANDSLTIQAYNWSGASWDDVGTLQGANGTTDVVETVNLLLRHTGTGSDLGKIRIRLYAASGLTSATLAIDQIITSYTVVSKSVGYALGSIWLDTNASNTNTEAYVDGVADNPVSTLAAANTLISSLGLTRLFILSGSSITLASSQQNQVFQGQKWTLALGSQDITGTEIEGASGGVSGTATGTNPFFYECSIGNVTLPPSALQTCGFSGTFTVGSAGDFFAVDCFSQIAGTSTPVIDMGAAVGATNFNFRRYSGGIEIQNLAAGDNISLEGVGQLVVNANCTGGTIAVRGTFRITDNSSGAVDLVITTPVSDQVHQGTAQGGTSNTITLSASASSTDGAYDPGSVLIISGPGAGESRDIIDYDGTTKIAVVGKDWRTTPTSSSSYVVFASSGALHVNEGMAQAGGASSITLNSVASSTNDIYIGQTIFVVGGTGQDQSRIVTDYNGTTKVATVHKAWDTQPDSTSSYVMIPLPAAGDYIVNATPASISDAVWDEAASGHNAAGTFGKYLRQIKEGVVSIEGSVNDLSATTTTFITDLSEATTSHYSDLTLMFIDGALQGQAKPIGSYNGTTKAVTLDEALTEAPANGDSFIILAIHVHPVSQIAENVRTEIDSNSTQLSAIVSDTSELQTDWADGGRLDVILDELTTQGDTNETKLDTIDSNVDDVLVDTGTTLPATLSTLTTNLATVDSNVDAILVDTGTTLPAQISGLNDVSVSDILTTQMTESYSTDGSAPTITQALMMIQQMLGDFAISGTTLTVKKVDGSTAAATYTLDDGTSPTSITRAT